MKGPASNLKLILSAEAGLSGTWEFTEPALIHLGRDRRLSINPGPGPEITGLSRFHAVIELAGGRAAIRDLGSLMGTHLNGHLVGRRTPAEPPSIGGPAVLGEGVELADGDIIQLGPLWLRVFLGDAGTIQTSHNRSNTCAGCNRPLTRPTTLRNPDALCDQCRSNPMAALKLLRAGLSRRIADLTPLVGLRVEKTLGQGATSAVFLVSRKKSEARLAQKVLPPAVSDNDWARKSFLREAALGRALKHPNVARLFESGRYGGAYFVMMEYCAGGSSEEERVIAGGRLSPERALSIILPTLDGLDYLHNVRLAATVTGEEPRGQASVGLVHRDLKPANIFLGGEDGLVPKIADIGVAKFHGWGGSCDTRTGTVAGSPATMPRQQAANFKYAGPEVDIWAAAASLYKLLTGEYPRNFPPDPDPWQVVMNEKPRPLLTLQPDAPPNLAAAIDRALTDDPEITHQRAVDLTAVLIKAAELDDIQI
jgi:hypothetical protein